MFSGLYDEVVAWIMSGIWYPGSPAEMMLSNKEDSNPRS